MERKIVWTDTALYHLEEIYLYLLRKTKSIKIADKITGNLYSSASILASHPEIYQLDGLKASNDGTIRVYEISKYRISYQVTKTEINILRVRHTSREPMEY